MTSEYDAILADMVQVAREAGALTLTHFARFRDLEIGIKGPADFVSDADRESEQLIRKFLFARYPDWSFTGEEFPPVDGKDREHRWLVDPIDGTTNFINGQHYTISIALRRGNETVCGALYNPAADEMFTAIRGQGAYLNGERLAVSEQTEIGLMTVGTGLPTPGLFTFPASTPGSNACATRSAPFASSAAPQIRAPMSPGPAHRLFRGDRASSTAAVGILLVEEAGGIVTDWWGRGPEFYEKTGCVIVANKATHAYLLDQLRDAPMKNDAHKKPVA